MSTAIRKEQAESAYFPLVKGVNQTLEIDARHQGSTLNASVNSNGQRLLGHWTEQATP